MVISLSNLDIPSVPCLDFHEHHQQWHTPILHIQHRRRLHTSSRPAAASDSHVVRTSCRHQCAVGSSSSRATAHARRREGSVPLVCTLHGPDVPLLGSRVASTHRSPSCARGPPIPVRPAQSHGTPHRFWDHARPACASQPPPGCVGSHRATSGVVRGPRRLHARGEAQGRGPPFPRAPSNRVGGCPATSETAHGPRSRVAFVCERGGRSPHSRGDMERGGEGRAPPLRHACKVGVFSLSLHAW
jgi:hypothetical protein